MLHHFARCHLPSHNSRHCACANCRTSQIQFQWHVFQNASPTQIVRVFQNNTAGLAFYFLLLAAGQTAILKATNFVVFLITPLLIFLFLFAASAAFFQSYAIPLTLILWIAWVLALLIVLVQIKMQRATNMALSLLWGALFFVFSSVIIIALPVTFLSTTHQNDDNQREGIRVIAFPLSAIIVLFFLEFHFHFFKDLRKQAPAPLDPQQRKKFFKCEAAYLVLTSVALAVFNMGVLLRLEDQIVIGTSTQQRTIIFALVAVPVIFFFCIELMRWLLPYRNKYLVYPLALIFPLIYFSNLAVNLGPAQYYYILDAVALMTPFLGVLFTTLLVIVKESQRSCMFMTALANLGVVMPFAYVQVVQLNGSFIQISTYFIQGVGIASCVVIFGVLAYNLYKFRQQSKKRKLCALASNYTQLGHWFNTTGFILGEGVLIYVGFNYPITTDLRYGFTYACGFGIFLLFLVTNLILEQRSHVPAGDEDSNYFDYVFQKVFKDLSEHDQVALRQDSISDGKFTVIILVILLLIVPAALLPVGLAVTTFNGAIQSSLIISAAFSALIACLGVIAIEVKKKLGPYSRNGLPLCLSMLWAFVAVPFFAILPVATILTGGQQSSVEILVTASLLVMAALLVIGTSLLSVILNEVFRRIEYELKAKLAVIRLFESLKTIAVKGEPMPLRLCVDTYIWKGRMELANRLEAQDLVLAWELPPTDPDPTVSKVLVTKDFYQKMERRSLQDKKRADYREMKVEQKFQKAVEKRRNEKKKMKQRLERMKDSARKRAERLEGLLHKEKKLKGLLGSKNALGESKSSLNSKENEMKLSTSMQSQPGRVLKISESDVETPRQKTPLHAYGVQTFGSKSYSQFKGNLGDLGDVRGEDEKEEDDLLTEEKQRELQEIRDALRTQNYRVLTSQNTSEEEKLVAVFEIISDKSSVHTIQQLLKISTKPLDALEQELFTYFAADAQQKKLERAELEVMFEVFEASSRVEEYLQEGEEQLNLKRFKEVIGELSFKEYPAYTRAKARQLFLTGVAYHRLSYYQKEFAGHAFALYLLNTVRKEVEEIREKRIKEMLHIEEKEEEEYEAQLLKEEEERIGKCRAACGAAGRKKCRGKCLKCVACVRNSLRWLTVKLVICCCFAGTNARHKELDSKEFQEDITEEELERLRPSQRRKQEVVEHRPSPDWKQISEHILEETKGALQLYDPKRGLVWKCTMPNVVMLLIKLLEFFSFLSFMWGSDIPWNFSDTASTALTSVNGDTAPSLQVYYYFYGLSLALAILYTFLIRPAAIKARDGTLGMNKDGIPAKLCTRAFLFSKLVQLMSASLYTFIVKNLLDAFSCDFSNTSQAVLLKQADVSCFGGLHFGLMGGALVGILAYYPFATFLYANLQFVNKDTDLKYNPQFMVYLAQAKLIFSSLASFLHSSDSSLIVRLALMAATTFFLGMTSAYQQPCLVVSSNIFHTAGYFSVSYLIVMTIFIVLSVNNTIVVAIMCGGVFLIWLITTIIACVRKKRSVKREEPRRQEQPVPEQ